MIEIVAGSHRDISDVVSNLRAIDHQEIYCQMDEGCSDMLVVMALEHKSWVCRLNGQPVAVFSFSAINVSTVAVNLFGTDKITRAIPAITRFIFVRMIPDALSCGIRRFEARSLTTHAQAHRWLEACGAVKEGLLPEFGKNGEDFYIYGLTRTILEQFKPKRWQSNVFSTGGS
ncbi:MAG: hypothetical protein GY761_13075 [Hyphomicrobiales bacterium]|nr:hypothetical protein [Hyphomicrobiales bacterium]